MQEDEQLLTGGTKSRCHHEVVKLRLCEKRLLQAASDHAREQREKMEREGECDEAALLAGTTGACGGSGTASGDCNGAQEPIERTVST